MRFWKSKISATFHFLPTIFDWDRDNSVFYLCMKFGEFWPRRSRDSGQIVKRREEKGRKIFGKIWSARKIRKRSRKGKPRTKHFNSDLLEVGRENTAAEDLWTLACVVTTPLTMCHNFGKDQNDTMCEVRMWLQTYGEKKCVKSDR